MSRFGIEVICCFHKKKERKNRNMNEDEEEQFNLFKSPDNISSPFIAEEINKKNQIYNYDKSLETLFSNEIIDIRTNIQGIQYSEEEKIDLTLLDVSSNKKMLGHKNLGKKRNRKNFGKICQETSDDLQLFGKEKNPNALIELSTSKKA